MLFFPAIDLKDGNCVRLYKGDMEKATIFSNSPENQAKIFQEEGADYLHIVDLNGAFAGKPVNDEAVRKIIANIEIPVQLGGGIRNIATIESWLEAGVSRVILGTAAVKNPDFVKEACKKFPHRIVVGVDAKNGFVAVEGWAKESEITTEELAKKFEDSGVASIIYTDISKDGAMQGADISGTSKLAKATKIPVIASGGVSSLDDLRLLKAIEKDGVAGVISGRAIYEKAFTIRDAIEILR
ncbi:MAG: 1-(5-phosphoribosyl)-5-[(5-phosphoribosylamino)methylideneamino]imidazole-4-carboxamide isomerase [Rickettsiales bacterium]|nr:1-(5-phosphoribosyl)-5-[(5-phosphoribosylamino)methylideneamino]imidazole-4-carboxamide isomerase [Rickettsiales bacterium]